MEYVLAVAIFVGFGALLAFLHFRPPKRDGEIMGMYLHSKGGDIDIELWEQRLPLLLIAYDSLAAMHDICTPNTIIRGVKGKHLAIHPEPWMSWGSRVAGTAVYNSSMSIVDDWPIRKTAFARELYLMLFVNMGRNDDYEAALTPEVRAFFDEFHEIADELAHMPHT